MNLIPVDGDTMGSLSSSPQLPGSCGEETFPRIALEFCWLCLMDISAILSLMPLRSLLSRLVRPSSQLPSPFMFHPHLQANLIVLLDLLQFAHGCGTGSPREDSGPQTWPQEC